MVTYFNQSKKGKETFWKRYKKKILDLGCSNWGAFKYWQSGAKLHLAGWLWRSYSQLWRSPQGSPSCMVFVNILWVLCCKTILHNSLCILLQFFTDLPWHWFQQALLAGGRCVKSFLKEAVVSRGKCACTHVLELRTRLTGLWLFYK